MAQTLIAMTPDELRAMIREELAKATGQAEPAKRYMTAKEIAKQYGVSRATVNNWSAHEGCPHILRGKVLRFELAAVEAWMHGRTAIRGVK